MFKNFKSVILTVVLLVIPAMSVVQANFAYGQSQDDEYLDSRIPFVFKLIYESSGARHIEANGNVRAQKLHLDAKDLYQRCLIANQDGDAVAVKALLDEAIRTMYAAIREAKTSDSVIEKRKNDYIQLKKTVDVFKTTLERVAKEKGAEKDAEKVLVKVREREVIGEQLFQKKAYLEAKVPLHEAYVLLKEAIQSLRDGDTLRADLSYATPEDEYLAKQQMAESILLLVEALYHEGKVKSKSSLVKLNSLYQKADEALRLAKAAFAKGHLDEASNHIENALSALRRAGYLVGVYIPR